MINLKEKENWIKEITNVFVAQKTEFGRYSSWDYCYGLAQCMHERKEDLEDWDYDYMALNLAFYLASWGMYRGSSFLLDKSYKVHIDPIRHIFDKDELWGMPLSSEELTDFARELASAYGVKIKIQGSEDSDEISDNMTDTLFTKILLGITGNVVAYDRYCKSALSFLGLGQNFFKNKRDTSWDKLIKEDGEFNHIADALRGITSEYQKVEFKNGRYVQTEENVPYPDAKNVDMFLFELGMICDAVKVYCNTSEKKPSTVTQKESSKKVLENCFHNGLTLENTIFKEVVAKKGCLKDIEGVYKSSLSD